MAYLVFRLVVSVITIFGVILGSIGGCCGKLTRAYLRCRRDCLLAISVVINIGIVGVNEGCLYVFNIAAKHVGLTVIDTTHDVLSILVDELIVSSKSAGLAVLDLHDRADVMLKDGRVMS